MSQVPQTNPHERARQRTTTQRIALYAVLCALEAICTLLLEIPLLPGITFLKYDPSGIIAMLGTAFFGLPAALVLSTLPFLMHIATQTGIYGVLMSSLVMLAYTLPAALIINKKPQGPRFVMGLMIGSACGIVAALLANVVITPLYTGMPVEAVVSLMIPALIPFNLFKVALNSIGCALMIRPITSALNGLRR